MSAISELSSMSRRKGPVTAEEKRANRRDNKAAYIFLLPWLIGLVAITVGPMLASLYLSFTDYNLLQPPEWVGPGQLHPHARRRAPAQRARA